jgi:hypothetical protein
MDAIERAVVAPQIKIVEKRAAWRQIFRNRPPLASCVQHIHDPAHHLAHVDVALVAAAPDRVGYARLQVVRTDDCPLCAGFRRGDRRMVLRRCGERYGSDRGAARLC